MFISKVINTASRVAKMAQIARTARQTTRGSDEARRLAKHALANLLADARGVPMKIGQFLATMPGDEIFQGLVKSIQPRSLSEMLPVLQEGLGRPVKEVFSSIDESEAAASLGQVHHAVLLDGTQVAVKLRYPDISDAVEAEMRLAGLIPGVGPAKKWGFDLGAYKTALKQNMDRELDYRDESQRQERFRRACQVPGLVVPRVYDEWCSSGVLVQSWESGQRLQAVQDWSHAQRVRVGTILMTNLFASLFVTGEIHGDPHAGNLYFRRKRVGTPEVVLLDYGCTVPVPEHARWSLLKLIVGCHDRDETDPLRCLAAIGFDPNKLLPIADVLPALCQLLFEPFCRREPFSTQYWDVNRRVGALLGELRWWFRSAGPANLILLMRAINGLVSQLVTLKVILPWWGVLVDALGEGMIDHARHYTPPPLSSHVNRGNQTFQSVAQFLKIRVTEASRQVVALSMPASQVPFIQDQIPEDVLTKIRDAQINLDEIVRRTCEQGIVPGELFTLDTGCRQYRVWLE